jgi:hypothetical protein
VTQRIIRKATIASACWASGFISRVPGGRNQRNKSANGAAMIPAQVFRGRLAGRLTVRSPVEKFGQLFIVDFRPVGKGEDVGSGE